MKIVTLYAANGGVIRQWRAADVAQHQGSFSFYDQDSAKLDLVQISGTVTVERTYAEKHGQTEK